MSDPYFATGYIRLLYRYVQAEGVTAANLFAGIDTDEATLMKADYEMPFAAQMRFCQNATAHSLPGIGLRVGHHLQLAAHGTLGTAMQSAPCLRQALTCMVRLIHVRASFFSLALVESNSNREASFTIETHGLPGDLVAFFTESVLCTINHCYAFYTGQPAGPGPLSLAYPMPSYHEDYATAFGADNVSFNASKTRVTFPRSSLELPSPEADSNIHAESIHRCQEQIAHRSQLDSITASIEVFLSNNPGKLWRLDELAPLFSVSKRTLIRRLKAEGTTYQQLRDHILRQQALRYLSVMNVEASAAALGFADTSSFRRTCKRWFGEVPSALQRR